MAYYAHFLCSVVIFRNPFKIGGWAANIAVLKALRIEWIWVVCRDSQNMGIWEREFGLLFQVFVYLRVLPFLYFVTTPPPFFLRLCASFILKCWRQKKRINHMRPLVLVALICSAPVPGLGVITSDNSSSQVWTCINLTCAIIRFWGWVCFIRPTPSTVGDLL